MNELKVFESQKFGELEILDKEGKIFFPATDVAKNLGYSKPHDAIKRHCKELGTTFHGVRYPSGTKQKKFIDEGNLYRLITNSKLPEAEKFEAWVFDEVLPDIRKHGMYATPQTVESMLSDPDTAIQLLENYKQEKNQRLIAEQRLKELEPKATYYDVVLQNKSLVTIGQIAKDYGMSAQALNKLLHELKVQYKQSGQWLLYSNLHDKGYTHSSTTEIEHKDGSRSIRMNTKWTQKGRLFIYGLLKGEGVLPMIEREGVS